MSTHIVSATTIKRQWHMVNAKNKPLGRIATDIAKSLMGKYKTNYVPYLDMGDYVVVTNASLVKLTGKKADQKKYTYHSGYPGGLRVESFESMIVRRPDEVIKKAVWGMVPKTKLGKQMIKRLKIYAGNEHPYKKNLKKEEDNG